VAWGPLAKRHGIAWAGGVQVTPEGKGRWNSDGTTFQLDRVNAQNLVLPRPSGRDRYRLASAS